jgi:hypothetical protein
VPTDEWLYFKYKTNKSATVRDAAAQEWLLMSRDKIVESIFQGIT